MRIRKSAEKACVKLAWLTGCCAASALALAQANPTEKPAAAIQAPHKAARPAPPPAGAGFTIARVPGWVQPLAFDPAAPMDAAPYQFPISDEQVELQPGGSTVFYHYMRRVNDASGLQQAGQIALDFDPSYQRLVFHKVDILRGGRRIDKLDAHKIKLLHREQQLERQMIDGRMTASIVLDDVRVGDSVEWEASIVGANPVFGDRFVDTHFTEYPGGPTGVWQLRILGPAAREIHARVGDPAVETSTVVRAGVRETLYRRRNLPQLQVDNYAPPGQLLKSQVWLSEFADWHEVAAWASRLFAHAMQPTPALDAQVAALKAKAGPDAPPQALLRTTLDFVQKDIRYFGSEAGIESHQPADVDTVLRQRFGDCKDKVALLAALLRRMGFDATPVLVSANYTSATATQLPSPLAFDHAIVRLVQDGQPLWLDATRSEQTGVLAERGSTGLGFGLVVQDDTTGLAELPNGRDRVRIETADTFSFPKLSQEGTLTSVTTYHGDIAEGLRSALDSQPRAEIEKALVAEQLRSYPTLTVAAPADILTDTEDNTVKVTTHFRTGDFWSFPEQKALAGRFSLYNLVAPLRLPDQASRTQPFNINLPGRYLHELTFDFGQGFPGAPNATHFDESDKNFDLHVQFDIQSPHQTVRGELRQLTDAIDPGDWPAYREKLNKVVPRVVGGFTVSAIAPEQMQDYRAQVTQLVEKMRKGDVKVVTPTQATAQLKILALDRMLDADRLAPKLRAQALVNKAEQLDFLGRAQEAKPIFDAAIALDAANADFHEALAVNAMQRRSDDEALREVDEALRLSPSNSGPLYIRGYTHFVRGDAPAARDDFLAVLKSRTEVERSYGAIWLYLADRRAGGDGLQAAKPFEPTASHPEWPNAVLQLMEGRIDFNAALDASQENGQRSASRECELYFYAAEKALADGDLSLAHTYLRKSVATGVTEFTEYSLSQRELDRIDKR